MIRLFVSDLDGTLLTNNKLTNYRVSDENRHALSTLINSGVRFVAASGRHHNNSIQIAEDLGFPFDAIGSNGATIMRNGKCIRHRHVDREQITYVIDTLYEMNVWDRIGCFVANNNYEHIFNEPHNWLFNKFEESYKNGQFGPCLDIPLNEYIHNPYSPIPTKLVIEIKEGEDINEWLKICRDKFADGFDIFSSGSIYIEFVAPSVSKGEAIRYLMKEYNLNEDEVAVIGDAANDISMFLTCNHSYCMHTATPSVKKYADKIVKTAAEAMYDVLAKNERERTQKL